MPLYLLWAYFSDSTWCICPAILAILAIPGSFVLAGVLYVVQFIADKIPAIDSVWDMIHTFIRVPAGAVLAATAFAQFDPTVRAIALLLGGGIALSSHGTKTATRLAANASPEPFSNIGLSLLGDAVTFIGVLLMTVHPAVLIAIVLIAVIASVLLVHWIVRWLRSAFRRRTSASMA